MVFTILGLLLASLGPSPPHLAEQLRASIVHISYLYPAPPISWIAHFTYSPIHYLWLLELGVYLLSTSPLLLLSCRKFLIQADLVGDYFDLRLR